VGEPSRWDRITLGYRGSIECRLRMRAPWAHSAGKEALPAERAVELWQCVEAFVASENQDRPGDEFRRFDAALRSIRTRADGPFGAADLVIGLRLPVGATIANVSRRLRSALEARVESWKANGAEVRVGLRGGQEAWRASKSTSLVSAFLRSIRTEGGEPRFVVKTGTADFNIVGPAWPEVPIVAYGPGDSGLDHTPVEHILIEEYELAIRVLSKVLVDLTR
jgi:LysW-gamma-L-lysine carboxypeptidase